jgi:ATP-dependent DNA ligase
MNTRKVAFGKVEPMEAKLASELPTSGQWQYEPKWDGFRCMVFRRNAEIQLQAKSGKSLTRYFPEIVAAFAPLAPKHFVIDGELLIPAGKTLSFDALQMRLHPAQSRIDRLALETPALFMAFDLLVDEAGADFRDAPLTERRRALERLQTFWSDPSLKAITVFTRKQRCQGMA